MEFCHRPKKLMNVLFRCLLYNCNEHSTFDFRSFLSMLERNKEIVVWSPIWKRLCELLMFRLLQVGCGERTTAMRILVFYDEARFNFNHNILNTKELMDHAFYYGDVLLMKALVQYGCVDTTLQESEEEFKTARTTIFRFWETAMTRDWLSTDYFSEFLFYLEPLMTEVRTSRSQQLVFKKGARRFLLLARLLNLFLLRGPMRRRKYNPEPLAKCIRLYFSVIPDPFISTEELVEFLEVFYHRRISIDGQNIVVATYETYFSLEASSPYQPRTLKDLCRCSVRQAYGKQPETLPILVRRMWIPQTLKDFLLVV